MLRLCLKPNLPLLHPCGYRYTLKGWEGLTFSGSWEGEGNFLFLPSGFYFLELSGTSHMPFKRWAVLQAAIYPSKISWLISSISRIPLLTPASCLLILFAVKSKCLIVSLVLFQGLNIEVEAV